MLIQDLQAGLKKALSGDVETLLLELLMPPVEFEADRMQQAMVVRLPTQFFRDQLIRFAEPSFQRCFCSRTVAGFGHR